MKSTTTKKQFIMNRKENHNRSRINRRNIWVAIGAIILIILLIIWLTMADLAGDTDVAALILPRL